MRPGQNNNKQRMRGRNNNNNNNRRSPNPLTRSYESNGPDVKIRGTAHHVGEKYLQLARDAQTSGDPVMAESYLQHAEHYFRMIAAAQLAQQQAQAGYQRGPNEAAAEEEEDDDDFGGLPDRFASPMERFAPAPPPQPAPQPYAPQPQAAATGQVQPQPYQDRGSFNGERPQQQDRGPYNGERQPYGDRPQQGRGDRPQNQNRPNQDRNNPNRFNPNREQRDFRPPRDFRNEPQPRADGGAAQAAPEPEPVGLPSFITTPVRALAPVEDAPAPEVSQDEPRMGGYHLRPRRRRGRPEGDHAQEDGGQGATEASPEPSLSND
jgi:hypothetical protein